MIKAVVMFVWLYLIIEYGVIILAPPLIMAMYVVYKLTERGGSQMVGIAMLYALVTIVCVGYWHILFPVTVFVALVWGWNHRGN